MSRMTVTDGDCDWLSSTRRIRSKLQHLTHKLDMQSDIIKEYSGMVPRADANADHNNWNWNSTLWELADNPWQEFSEKWYGCDDDSLLPGSSLSLQPLATLGPQSLLLRGCYVEIFCRVWARAFSSLKVLIGAIITGQPGTGKSLLAYFILVKLLQRKQIVLFSDDGTSVFLFYCGKVYESNSARLQGSPRSQLPKPSLPNLFIWSIFDIAKMEEPARFFFDSPCLPVQTTSPDPGRYKIWSKQRQPMCIGMPLWTRSELVLGLEHQLGYSELMDALEKYYLDGSGNALDKFPGTRNLLDARVEDKDDRRPSPKDALDYLLDESVHRFGYSARDVYSGLFNYRKSTLRHQEAFQIDYEQLMDAVRALSANDSAPHAISHRILALIPMNSVAFEDVVWEVNFKSLWVLKTMMQRLGDVENTLIGQCISYFHRNPAASWLAGQFLEPFAHRAIVDTRAGGFWPLTEMTCTNDNVNSPLFVIRSSPIHHHDVTLFPKIKREIVKFVSLDSEVLTQNTYYIPEDPNFPLFDAFTFELDPRNKLANLWVLQMTTSRLYGGSESARGSARGYQQIRMIIAKLKVLLKSDPPQAKAKKLAPEQSASDVTVHVHYLLVVPKGDFDRRWDFPLGWDQNRTRNDHRGKVYCLEVAVSVKDIADQYKT